MKKVLFFFLLISTGAFSQIDSVSVAHCKYFYPPQTIYGYTVDSFDINHLRINSWSYDSAWQVVQRVNDFYSPSGLLLHEKTQSVFDTGWITTAEIFNTYDLHDSLMSNSRFTYFYYLGIRTSTYGYRTDFSFDTLALSKSTTYSNYIDSMASWTESITFIDFFDSAQRVKREEIWLPNNYLDESFSYNYRPDGLTDFYIDSDLTYGDISKFQYFYDTLNLLFLKVDSTWNYWNQDYDPRRFEEFYYDSSGNMTAQSNHLIISDTLIDWCGDTAGYQYNLNNQEIAYSFQSCGGGGNEGSFTYDSLSILQATHHCSWNHGDGYNCQDCDYTYYKAPFNQSVAEQRPVQFKIFPNPAGDYFYIQFIGNENSDLTIEVFNTLGTALYSKEKATRLNQINITDLPEGIYFVKICSQTSCFSQKLIVQRN